VSSQDVRIMSLVRLAPLLSVRFHILEWCQSTLPRIKDVLLHNIHSCSCNLDPTTKWKLLIVTIYHIHSTKLAPHTQGNGNTWGHTNTLPVCPLITVITGYVISFTCFLTYSAWKSWSSWSIVLVLCHSIEVWISCCLLLSLMVNFLHVFRLFHCHHIPHTFHQVSTTYPRKR
jgi:hypothetical protein